MGLPSIVAGSVHTPRRWIQQETMLKRKTLIRDDLHEIGDKGLTPISNEP
jgi:hypothetical protein